MKIVNLKAENFKKLTAVEITPEGNTVIISGKNGAGKSSVLDAIEVALCGGRNIPKQPVKQGEYRASVELNMGEYRVTRKFLGTKSTLVVETTGDIKSKISSPQAFLDSLVGEISFDPLAFMRKTPSEQRTTVLNFLGVDLTAFDETIAGLKTKRSEIRIKKEHAIHRENTLSFTSGLPEIEQDSKQILSELDAVQKENERIQQNINQRELLGCRLVDIESQIIEAQNIFDSAKKRLETLRGQHNTIREQVEAMSDSEEIKDTSAIQAKLKSLEETNKAIRNNQQQQIAAKEAEKYTEEYSRLGIEAKKTEEQKARKMAEVTLPVQGLAVATDGLIYNGLPLEQVNDGKKLEICVAISMALNPKLKVIRINGNDLDKESLTAIGRMVGEKDYQIWIERVSDDKTLGFYIEDGMLESTNKEQR